MDISVVSLNLPASFNYAGNFTLASEISKTNAAHTKPPQKSPGAATKITAVISSHLKLRLAFLLIDQRFLSHNSPNF